MMFKALVIVLALAGYGGYAAFSDNSSQDAARTTQAGLSPGQASSSSLADSAMQALSKTTGFTIAPLPARGCSESALPPERVMQLVSSLSEPTRSTIAQLLNASSSLWTVQLYLGADGTGFCLPQQSRVVLISGLALTDQTAAKPSISEKIGETISGIGQALPDWFAPSGKR